MANKAAAAKTRERTMSEEHKAALAEGREHGRVVRRYPNHRSPTAPGRGCKRTPQSITKRLAAIDEQLATADPLNRLRLVQERLRLERQTASTDGDGADLEELEAAFVEVAAAYGERKGLTYEAALRRRGTASLTRGCALLRCSTVASQALVTGICATSARHMIPRGERSFL